MKRGPKVNPAQGLFSQRADSSFFGQAGFVDEQVFFLRKTGRGIFPPSRALPSFRTEDADRVFFFLWGNPKNAPSLRGAGKGSSLTGPGPAVSLPRRLTPSLPPLLL